MPERPVDIDTKQAGRDLFFTRNRYKLDTRFLLKDGKKHPLAILVPGGGYFMVCSFIEGVPIAKKLNEKGISCVIVYYSVKKKALCPAPIDDLARGVKEVLSKAEEWNLETDNYSVWGASAGGHLVAEFGTDNLGYGTYDLPSPGCLVLTYPVITMDKEFTHMGSHDNFLGKDASKEAEEKTSVEKHVWEGYPKTYIWCGTADTEVDNRNTHEMVKSLEEKGIEHKCHIFENVKHGVGPGTGTPAEGWIEEAVDFWLNEKENR